MLEIKKSAVYHELEFKGIKILDVNNTTKFYKEVLLGAELTIDNKSISNDDIIFINELSKVTDFLDLTKKSQLFSDICDLLEQFPIINTNSVNSIFSKLNAEYDDLIEMNDGDIFKIVNSIFDLKDEYLNLKLLELLVNKCYKSRKTIILDNVSWFTVEFALKYINMHNFILITNDFFSYLTLFKDIEMVSFINREHKCVCVRDPQIVLEYLQKSINSE